MSKRNLSGLPDLPAIANRSGTPNAALTRDVKRFLEFSHDVYPDTAHRPFGYAPESAAELVQRYAKTPEPYRTVGHEALVQLRALFENQFHDEQGREAWEHQIGNLIDRQFSLWAGKKPPESFLYDGEANSGKTWQLAQEMRWVIHAQMRDVVKGSLVFMHAKPYHMGPHLYDEQGLLRRHRAHPSEERIELFLRRLAYRNRGAVDARITSEACLAIAGECGHSTKRTLKKLQKLCGEADAENDSGILRQIAVFLTGNGIEVQRVLPMGKMIELSSEGEDAKEDALEELGGDAGRVIPQSYLDEGKVLIWDRRMNLEEGGSNDLLEDAGKHAKVIILPMTAITRAGSRMQLADLLGDNVDWVLADESLKLTGADVARRGMAREHVYADQLKLPPCAAATNRQTHSVFDSVTRRSSIGELIERGTLGSFGVRIGPDRTAEHYPTDSVEYLREALRMYFAKASLPEHYELPQVWERNGLVVTHPELVLLFSQLLDEAYRHLHPELRAQIIPMMAGTNDDQDQVGGILTAMNDVRGDGPNVLVTSIPRIKDSAHLGRIRSASIFTRVGADGLWGVFSRLLHSTDHRMKQKNGFRTYMQILQGSDANTYETPFSRVTHEHQVKKDANGRIAWADFQVLLSVADYTRDAQLITRKKSAFPVVTIPKAEADTAASRDLKQQSGTMLVPRRMFGNVPYVHCPDPEGITTLDALREHGLFTTVEKFMDAKGVMNSTGSAKIPDAVTETEPGVDALISEVDKALQGENNAALLCQLRGRCERCREDLQQVAASKNEFEISMLTTAIRMLSK